MSNEQLYEAAMRAIKELFCDSSVSEEKAVENLQGLRDEIDAMIDSVGA